MKAHEAQKIVDNERRRLNELQEEIATVIANLNGRDPQQVLNDTRLLTGALIANPLTKDERGKGNWLRVTYGERPYDGT